jgi:hypothetical protein
MLYWTKNCVNIAMTVKVLHDHQPGAEPPLIFDGAFVVAPVSPDPNSREVSYNDGLRLTDRFLLGICR